MQIRSRLTLQFAILVGIILIVFSISIYYFSASYREKEFYHRLKQKAITKVKLLVEVDEVDYNLLKIIDKNSLNVLPAEKIVIYNYLNEQVYNSIDEDTLKVPVDLLNQIRLENEVRYTFGGHEAIGILYADKYNRFVVLASAYDQSGLSRLKNLQLVLITGLFATVAITVMAGLFYSKQALNPISQVVNQVDKITIANLSSRVNEGNGSDEIAQLAIKFNKMLERLEAAFEMQKSFVANASHELRTPLTSITGQIEVSLMNIKDKECTGMLNSILEDIRSLNKLSNGLLDLAQVNQDTSGVRYLEIRIDELLGQARADLIKRQDNFIINILFQEFPDDERKLIVEGNEQLLKTAIMNLMENGCKYSGNAQVNVHVFFEESAVILQFIDTGIGIPEGDLKNIFEPFYRAANAKRISGHGIGLTLTKKIVMMHAGDISVESELDKGTKVILKLPLMNEF